MHLRREFRAHAWRLIVWAVLTCPALTAFGQSDGQVWPNIGDPGLDLGDFPNGAYTIPAGAWQVEFAPFTIVGAGEFNQPEYMTQFLLRFGLTDDVEFRVLGDGYTALYTEPQTTGFSPITLDAKVHLWDENRECFLPASSLEVALSTDWGSRAFSGGYKPSINLNFDFPITESLNFEWTVGYGEVLGSVFVRSSQGLFAVEENVNQVVFQWSFSQELTEDTQVFLTGQTAQSLPGQSAGTALAIGGSWRRSDRLLYYGLIGWGVTPDAPTIGAQLGLGIALGRPQSR